MAKGFDSTIKAGLLEKRKDQVQDIATRIISSLLAAGHEDKPKELAPKAVAYAEALVKEINRIYGEEEVLGISLSKSSK